MPTRRKATHKKTGRSKRTWTSFSKKSPTTARQVGTTARLYSAPGSRVQFNRLLNASSVFRPDEIRSFVYCDHIQLSSSAATYITGAKETFRLNSLFDPNLTSAGHQPYAYDQISGMYSYYRVYEAAFEIKFVNPSTDYQYAAVLIQSSADSYSLTGKTGNYIAEKPGGFFAPIKNSESSGPLTVIHGVKIWEVEGETYNNWLGNSGYQALVSGNPVACPTVSIAMGDWSSPGTESTVFAEVRIVMKARLFGRLTQTSS